MFTCSLRRTMGQRTSRGPAPAGQPQQAAPAWWVPIGLLVAGIVRVLTTVPHLMVAGGLIAVGMLLGVAAWLVLQYVAADARSGPRAAAHAIDALAGR